MIKDDLCPHGVLGTCYCCHHYDWIDVLIDTDPIELGRGFRELQNAVLDLVANAYPIQGGEESFRVSKAYLIKIGQVLARLKSQAE